MKPLSQDKQSVAWFKLAEYVGRGEKERALALHRLLTHSFHDTAFIKQLEADLLAFFDDRQALNQYIIAAQLYSDNGKFFEAASIYERLLFLAPETEEYRVQACLLFEQAGHTEKAKLYKSKG